jgi:dTDP-4-amino-4,6-dideoxygalactose transaminase
MIKSTDPDGDAGSHLLLRADDDRHVRALVSAAGRDGVLVRRVWDRPYYGHRVFARAGLMPEQLGVPRAARAEALASTLVSVPTPAELDEQGARRVARSVGNAFRNPRGRA